MSNDVLFYAQIGSLVTFVLVVFGVYRLLVEQKEATIQLLRQRLEDQGEKVRLLDLQTPDALAKSLSKRVERQLAEIERLGADGTDNKDEINRKEQELAGVQSKLASLLSMIRTPIFCAQPAALRWFKEPSTMYTATLVDEKLKRAWNTWSTSAAMRQITKARFLHAKASDLSHPRLRPNHSVKRTAADRRSHWFAGIDTSAAAREYVADLLTRKRLRC